ncbi:MAG: S8 family serine peptidase, partial [Thermoanaerobaculia bacterium]
GVCVDLFAPGTHIVSDWYSSPTAAAVSSGTSVAAPFVTGVAALCLQQFPDATPSAVSRTILAQATADMLGAVGNGSPNRLLFSQLNSLTDPAPGDSQLLGDPSFDYGTTFWALDICTVINPTGCGPSFDFDIMSATYPSRSGKHHASLGGPQKSFHLTSESVTIPSNVSRAELSVYLWVVARSKRQQVVDDVLKIEIRDSASRLLETVGTFSNLDASSTYVQRRFDLSRYRGKSIRISFTGIQNPGPPTWFLLDDVTLNVWH